MNLEAVGRVAMCHLGLEVCRKINDVDGAKRAFLGTNSTADAEALRDEGNLGVRGDLNAELPATDDRAGLLTFLPTFLSGSGQS